MQIHRRIKHRLINNEYKYTVFDICAGNCLTSSLLSHLFKLKKNYAIDIRDRVREGFKNIKRFEYLKLDIFEDMDNIIELINNSLPAIVVSVHPCNKLATQILEIFKRTKAEMALIMPCCEGANDIKIPHFISKKLSRYEKWCMNLALKYSGTGYVCKSCLSNKNIILEFKNI
jgi:hypothetical protein